MLFTTHLSATLNVIQAYYTQLGSGDRVAEWFSARVCWKHSVEGSNLDGYKLLLIVACEFRLFHSPGYYLIRLFHYRGLVGFR